MASKSKQVVRRGRPPVKRETVVIPGLREHKKATAAELGVTGAMMATQVAAGLVEVCGVVKSNKQGRPANIYKLTKAGNGKATALSNAAKKAAEVASV